MGRVYLDNAASTRMSDRAMEAMTKAMAEVYGNASSTHDAGLEARRAIEQARKTIGDAMGVKPERIVFTSGATEANNMALNHYALEGRKHRKNHIVVSAIEHPSILERCRELTKEGYAVTFVKPGESGIVYPQDIERAIQSNTCLVCVMAVNNETGVMQLVSEISKVCARKSVPLHIDATQAVGHVYFDAIGIGLCGEYSVSFSAHKFHGPKGIGCLIIPESKDLIIPLMLGGDQERGMRAGTLNTPAIVSMAEALKECRERNFDYSRIKGLKERLLTGLRKQVGGIVVNGEQTMTIPHILNVSFDGLNGGELASALSNIYSIDVSIGSACKSREVDLSYVLLAMGYSEKRALSSIRFSFSRYTTEKEIDYAISSLVMIMNRAKI